MHLAEVGLRNFRVYDGEHSIALKAPVGHRRVVLIGGLNGAGKTSLLSAITLALYGGGAAGLVFEIATGESGQRAYRRYLEESFSVHARRRAEREMQARVVLVDRNRRVQIRRSWWFSDSCELEDETLAIYEGDRPLVVEALTAQERLSLLQDHIDALAPARVAKFFFFDGEDIRRIAAQRPEEAVVEGLNQLLGFTPLQRSASDLDTLSSTLRRELPRALSRGLEEASESLDGARAQVAGAQARLSALRDEFRTARESLELAQRELESLFAGTEIQTRSEVLDAVADRERELATVTAEVQAFVGDVLSLTLPARLLSATRREVAKAAKQRAAVDARRVLRPVGPQLSRELLSEATHDLRLDPRGKNSLRKAFSRAWTRIVDAPPDGGEVNLFGAFETGELQRLRAAIDDVLSTARRELLARLVRQSHLEREIDRLRRAQGLFESGPRAKQLLETKDTKLRHLVEVEGRIAAAEADLTRLEHEAATRAGVVAKLQGQAAETIAVVRELAAADTMKQAVLEFMGELRQLRSEAVARETTSMMRRLVHKEEVIHEVRIEPRTFAIRILDSHGAELREISAGEKEVFALSLVWALARMSSRGLPVVIDTPLGRLDMKHRENVVGQFLPVAGEQVIVLATDSEIDARWYGKLREFLVQESVIEFSAATGTSRVHDGRYFVQLRAPVVTA